jgi:hypothetical protein
MAFRIVRFKEFTMNIMKFLTICLTLFAVSGSAFAQTRVPVANQAESCLNSLITRPGAIYIAIKKDEGGSAAQVLDILDQLGKLSYYSLQLHDVGGGQVYTTLDANGAEVMHPLFNISFSPIRTMSDYDRTKSLEILNTAAANPLVYGIRCSFIAGPGTQVGN